MKHQVLGWVFGGLVMVAQAVAAAPKVSDPWVPEMPPGAHAYGAFMVLDNSGDEAVSLIRAEAPGFAKIELHESVDIDGMHRMIEKDEIVIPAQGQTRLAPGGYHIMLIGPEKRLVEGDTVPLTLTFSDGTVIEVDAMVRKREQMMQHRHGHH